MRNWKILSFQLFSRICRCNSAAILLLCRQAFKVGTSPPLTSFFMRLFLQLVLWQCISTSLTNISQILECSRSPVQFVNSRPVVQVRKGVLVVAGRTSTHKNSSATWVKTCRPGQKKSSVSYQVLYKQYMNFFVNRILFHMDQNYNIDSWLNLIRRFKQLLATFFVRYGIFRLTLADDTSLSQTTWAVVDIAVIHINAVKYIPETKTKFM